MDLVLRDLRLVLCGHDHCLNAGSLTVLVIFHRHLSLAVGPQIGKSSVLADHSQSACEGMRDGNRHRHIFFRLIRGKAEHHSLVTGTCLQIGIFVVTSFKCSVHAHRNIRRLSVKCDHDSTGICIKADIRTGVTDLTDRIADDFLIIDGCISSDLAADHHKPGGGHCLTGYTAHGILG